MVATHAPVALVTGGSRGIGAASCRKLAAAGFRVAVNYRADDKAASNVVDAIRAAGGEARAFQADVSDHAAATGLVDAVVAAWGRLDVLVNNAGANRPAPFLDVTPDDLKWMFATNFYSAFYCSQAAGRVMRRQGAGRIVNLSSDAGILSRAPSAHYGAAKAAVISLTKSTAEALGPEVVVNGIAPGFIDTDLNRYVAPDMRHAIALQSPAKRWGTADEVADLVVFLATGPGFITGETVVIDGGIRNVYFVPPGFEKK